MHEARSTAGSRLARDTSRKTSALAKLRRSNTRLDTLETASTALSVVQGLLREKLWTALETGSVRLRCALFKESSSGTHNPLWEAATTSRTPTLAKRPTETQCGQTRTEEKAHLWQRSAEADLSAWTEIISSRGLVQTRFSTSAQRRSGGYHENAIYSITSRRRSKRQME